MFISVVGASLQLCISIDLIMTISQPFTPKEPRMRIYAAFAILEGLFQALTLTMFHEPTKVTTAVKIGELNGLCLVVLLWVVSIGSVIYGCIKLCKPNIS